MSSLLRISPAHLHRRAPALQATAAPSQKVGWFFNQIPGQMRMSHCLEPVLRAATHHTTAGQIRHGKYLTSCASTKQSGIFWDSPQRPPGVRPLPTGTMEGGGA